MSRYLGLATAGALRAEFFCLCGHADGYESGQWVLSSSSAYGAEKLTSFERRTRWS